MRNFFKILILILCCISNTAFAQKKKLKGPQFDIIDFNKKMDVAEWLCEYDAIAWQTSDSVMAQSKEEISRLGNEWFCFKDDNKIWHAVYGKYKDVYFDLVFHFTITGKSEIKRTYDKLDTALVHSYSRAMITANGKLKELKDTVNIRFNQFIRKNDDATFTVWIFPAFQPNGVAVYGGEFIYTIDATGSTVLKDDSYYSGDFYGHKSGTKEEIWLNYKDVGKPTLGAVFFVWYYKSYFPKILINTSNSISTVIQSGDNNWSWIHAEKDIEKNKKEGK